MERVVGMRRRAWAEINMDDARKNFELVRAAVSSSVKICCVIKANGYGHGAPQLAKLYEKLHADFFAVSNLEEALQLRESGITLPILILGYTPEECASLLAEQNISQCVYSYDYAQVLANYARKADVKVKIHIKLDTGMGRIGFLCRKDHATELEWVKKTCQMSEFIPEGIFTHFAVADENENGDAYTAEQYKQFIDCVSYLEQDGITFEIRHCANSAAIFDHPEYHLDMVRAGIVLYGLAPSGVMRNLPPLYPVMTVKSVISHKKDLVKGESISYGRTFTASENMTVATIPVGYADGFWRANGQGRYSVLIHGQYAPILGRICMDQLMVDVSQIPCERGDEVTIFGNDPIASADAVAKLNQTINYEVTCDVGMRVPRAYISNTEIVEWKDLICE